MAHAITQAPQYAGTERAAAGLTRLTQAFADWRLYRRTLADLSALNERELRDIGLHPSAIRQVAHEAAYGK